MTCVDSDFSVTILTHVEIAIIYNVTHRIQMWGELADKNIASLKSNCKQLDRLKFEQYSMLNTKTIFKIGHELKLIFMFGVFKKK